MHAQHLGHEWAAANVNKGLPNPTTQTIPNPFIPSKSSNSRPHQTHKSLTTSENKSQ